MPTVTCASSTLQKLDEIKSILRSLLISVPKKEKNNVTPQYLNELFNEFEGRDIPFKDYNFTSITEFLKSCNSVLRLARLSNNQQVVYPVDNKKTQHITKLVATAKVEKKKTKKKKFEAICHNNAVNPYVLHEIFNELTMNSWNYNSIVISKLDLLDEIRKRCQSYSFYEMENLNEQMNHYNHILSYSDDHIYFKVNNQSNQNHSNMHKKKVLFTSISDLIRESTKKRLQTLVEKFPQGFSLPELPEIFQHEFKMGLEYSDLGFNSVLEFVIALPQIFKIQPVNGSNYIVIGAKMPVNNYIFQDVTVNILEKKVNRLPIPDPVPKVVSLQNSKKLIPDYVLSCDEIVGQISVTSIADENCTEVVVSDVFTPSFFWITQLKNRKKMNNFMNALNDFYKQQVLDRYAIPPVVFQLGLNVACVFMDSWHRGMIRKMDKNKIGVLFYDYGTLASYKPNEVYFLDKKFSRVPAQAIPCSLYNVQPLDNEKWEKRECKIFGNKVLNRFFTLTIKRTCEETNSMIINLTDKKRKLDVRKWLIEENLAKEGQFNSEKNDCTLKFYQQCMKVPAKLKEESYRKEVIIKKTQETSESEKPTTTENLSMSRKLEIMRRFKERLSSSSQASTSFTSSVQLEDEKEIKKKEKLDDEPKDCSNYLSKSFDDDVSESTLSDSISDDSSLENSKYKKTEHEDSFSDFSSVSLAPTKSTLDSDDTNKKDSCISTCNDVIFKSCNISTLQFIESNKGCSRKKANRNANLIGVSASELQKLINSTKK